MLSSSHAEKSLKIKLFKKGLKSVKMRLNLFPWVKGFKVKINR